MKKVFSILVIAMLAMAMASCNKTNETESLIVGEWLETEVTGTTTINGVPGETISMLEPDETTTLSFKKNHTYTTTWKTEEGEVTTNGTWSATDDVLTMTSDAVDMSCHIDKLDKNNMILSYTESGVNAGVSYSTSVVMKMKRI